MHIISNSPVVRREFDTRVLEYNEWSGCSHKTAINAACLKRPPVCRASPASFHDLLRREDGAINEKEKVAPTLRNKEGGGVMRK